MPAHDLIPKGDGRNKRLNPKQRVFIEAYFADGEMNAARAAKAAGYKGDGAGDRLLNHAAVRQEIQRRMGKLRDKYEITADTVLQELACTAFMDPADLFTKDGVLLNVTDMPESIRRAIGSLEVEQTEDPETGERRTKAKIRLNNKVQALELLAKHLGILNERLGIYQTAGPDVISEVLRTINERQESSVIDAEFITHQAEEPQ